jgi:hypothetical protein
LSRLKVPLVFYQEAQNDIPGFYKTLPHWHWVENFLQKFSPHTIQQSLNENVFRVAGKSMNGLGFTFYPSLAHRDTSGTSKCVTS